MMVCLSPLLREFRHSRPPIAIANAWCADHDLHDIDKRAALGSR
jgi:hypothetical protein